MREGGSIGGLDGNSESSFNGDSTLFPSRAAPCALSVGGLNILSRPVVALNKSCGVALSVYHRNVSGVLPASLRCIVPLGVDAWLLEVLSCEGDRSERARFSESCASEDGVSDGVAPRA